MDWGTHLYFSTALGNFLESEVNLKENYLNSRNIRSFIEENPSLSSQFQTSIRPLLVLAQYPTPPSPSLVSDLSQSQFSIRPLLILIQYPTSTCPGLVSTPSQFYFSIRPLLVLASYPSTPSPSLVFVPSQSQFSIRPLLVLAQYPPPPNSTSLVSVPS